MVRSSFARHTTPDGTGWRATFSTITMVCATIAAVLTVLGFAWTVAEWRLAPMMAKVAGERDQAEHDWNVKERATVRDELIRMRAEDRIAADKRLDQILGELRDLRVRVDRSLDGHTRAATSSTTR
jgi:hypothetical protein